MEDFWISKEQVKQLLDNERRAEEKGVKGLINDERKAELERALAKLEAKEEEAARSLQERAKINLVNHYMHDFYKEVQEYTDQIAKRQIEKGAEKYPEPFNPDSWTGEELADHAMEENRDQAVYITGMRTKLRNQDAAYKHLLRDYNQLKHTAQAEATKAFKLNEFISTNFIGFDGVEAGGCVFEAAINLLTPHIPERQVTKKYGESPQVAWMEEITVEGPPVVINMGSVEQWNITSLRYTCKQNKVKGYTKMSKDELVIEVKKILADHKK